jgi:hypothetical protein
VGKYLEEFSLKREVFLKFFLYFAKNSDSTGWAKIKVTKIYRISLDPLLFGFVLGDRVKFFHFLQPFFGPACICIFWIFQIMQKFHISRIFGLCNISSFSLYFEEISHFLHFVAL